MPSFISPLRNVTKTSTRLLVPLTGLRINLVLFYVGILFEESLVDMMMMMMVMMMHIFHLFNPMVSKCYPRGSETLQWSLRAQWAILNPWGKCSNPWHLSDTSWAILTLDPCFLQNILSLWNSVFSGCWDKNQVSVERKMRVMVIATFEKLCNAYPISNCGYFRMK